MRRASSRPRVQIEYFTDPLCCWSWGFEPQWRRLRCEFEPYLACRYRMGGLLSDWAHYEDPINSVHRPLQMSPVWIQAHHVTGMPLDDRIWLEDPPESSYPASVAFKAAEMQSPEAGEACLRRLREAVMVERRNVARRDVIEEVAGELAHRLAGRFDRARFLEDLDGPSAYTAFREDVKQARYLGIGRFPALTLRASQGRGVILIGYRPYEALLDALVRVLPEAPALRRPVSRDVLQKRWKSLTERELAEADALVGVSTPETPENTADKV